MANNNTGGCAGGILQIFGGIGMLFLTCARMGDDVMRCGSAASKFDDIGRISTKFDDVGRTGSRVYYPADDAALSSTYTRYADDVYVGQPTKSQNAINESSSIPSSLVETEKAMPTVTAKRSITAKAKDYNYAPLRLANAGKDIPKLFDDRTVNEEATGSAEENIANMHKRLLQKFCDDYESRNPHFNRSHKALIVKGVKKAGSPNFLSMKAILTKIDTNIADLEESFPENKGYSSAYKRVVIDNFLIYTERMPEGEVIDFSFLALARRDSGFAVFLELTGDSQQRKKMINNMLRAR